MKKIELINTILKRPKEAITCLIYLLLREKNKEDKQV